MKSQLQRIAMSVKARARNPRGIRAGLLLLDRLGVQPATIVDVGASDGRWAELAQTVFPTAQMVLYEPHPAHRTALDRFQKKNPTAKVIRSAVGGANGWSVFDAADPWGGVLQKTRTTDSIDVAVVTLDDTLAESDPPYLVKLDTHGVEAAILAGAQATLARSVAYVVEAYNQRITPECLLFWELCDYMAAQGLRPVDLVDVMHRPRDGTLWQMDLVFIRSDWDGYDDLRYA